MYKRRRVRRIILPVVALALCAVTLCSTAWAAPFVDMPQTAAFVGSLLCAPGAAMAATKEFIDDSFEQEAVPTAQTVDENDLNSGFFTEMPTQQELAPASSAPASSAASDAQIDPNAPIPEGMAPLLTAHYGQGTGANYIASGAASIKNCTDLSSAEVAAEVMQALSFEVQINSAEPQVLIMHTHATENYESEDKNWCDPAFTARTTDVELNMVAVGDVITAELNAAGVNTLHDGTLNDYPSYTGSYANSNAVVRQYLAQYPSIKVVLDVHRDAIQKEDGTRVKPIAEINGEKTAQVMIICGADNNGNLPNFKQNLRFASRWQNQMEAMYPGFTRPVLFDYRYYNQDLTTGSLLIEVGGHANTLDEAKRAGSLIGKALGALFNNP